MTVLQSEPVPAQVGGVRFSVLGSGGPVTVFGHGLGGSAAETRPLATRTPGTRVLLDFRGHGRSGPLPGGWDYDLLADDLLAVADATGATRAVGLSVGSGALLRALTRDPARFERLGFVMPAALDRGRSDGAILAVRRLGRAIDDGNVDAVTEQLLDEVPDSVRGRRGVRLLVARRAELLIARPAPRALRPDRPVTDVQQLRDVTAPALVVAQEADALHSLAIAEQVAAALPRATLVRLPPGGVFWTASRQAAQALADHLSPDSPSTPDGSA